MDEYLLSPKEVVDIYTNLLFLTILGIAIYSNPNSNPNSSHRHPLLGGYIPNISLFMVSLYYLRLYWGFRYWLSFPLLTWGCFLDGMYSIQFIHSSRISFHLLSSIFRSVLITHINIYTIYGYNIKVFLWMVIFFNEIMVGSSKTR